VPGGVRFSWVPGWPEEVVHQAQALAVLRQAADDAKEAIDAAVPVVTGSYKAHFDLGLKVSAEGDHARIDIGEPRWHIIEHGSVNNPPYAPISKGVEATGMRFQRT
jgi:hypothetical protein